MKVFKYILSPGGRQKLRLPLRSKIISVKEQCGEIVLYAMVPENIDSHWPKEYFDVYVIGTGQLIPEEISEKDFIGTVSLNGGRLMFHVFVKGDGLCISY